MFYSHDCSTIVCLFGEYKKFKFLFNYKLFLKVALNFYTAKVCYPKSIVFMWMRQENIYLFHFFLFSLKKEHLGISLDLKNCSLVMLNVFASIGIYLNAIIIVIQQENPRASNLFGFNHCFQIGQKRHVFWHICC